VKLKVLRVLLRKKAEYERQAQAQSEVRSKVIESIEKPHNLHHVETKDTSNPHIEAVPLRKNVHSQVFEQIQKVEHSELKHVETKDKTVPVLDKNVHLKKDVRPSLFEEIKAVPLSEKKSLYEQNVESANKVSENFKNREGTDTANLSGLAPKLKQQYEKTVEEATKSDAKNKEGDTAGLSGLAQSKKKRI